jgi:ABC-2 type transport system permease protein
LNRARFLTIARYEAGVQLRSPVFWMLLLALLFVTASLNPVAMIPTDRSAVAGERAFANSAHALAQSFAIGSFFAFTFFAALMAGFAIIRDDEARIGDLLHSTPLTATEYALGKFAGVALALGAALGAQLLFALLFHEGRALAGSSPEAHGPFRLTAYLAALLLFALPGIAWIAAVAFAVGARSRRAMAVYAVPTMLFVFTILVSWNYAPRHLPAVWDRLLMIVDPTTIRWLDRVLFAVDRGVAYFNGAPPAFDPVFALNRLLTLSVAMFALWVSTRGPARRRRLRSRVAAGGSGSANPALAAATPASPAVGFRPLAVLEMTGRAPGLARGTWTILRLELGETLRQPALYLFAAFLMLVVVEVAGSASRSASATPMLLTAGGIALRALPVVSGARLPLPALRGRRIDAPRCRHRICDALFHPAPGLRHRDPARQGARERRGHRRAERAPASAAGLLLLILQNGGQGRTRSAPAGLRAWSSRPPTCSGPPS